MSELSWEYTGVVSSLRTPLDPTLLGSALLDAVASRYGAEHPACALLRFEQSGAHCLFDLASAAGLPYEDRTIAAWALTPLAVDARNVTYQRGFPMAAGPEDAPVDRGHLIPHLSGGEFGPNIFRQDRPLNRGWSAQGRCYRALEREAAATPGTLYFGHLLYADGSAYPVAIQIGLLRDSGLHVQHFDNQPQRREPRR